jgi:hypothetical protein
MKTGMVIYEVRAIVRPDLCEPYESYMTNLHIPDLLKTGYFSEASFERCGEGEYQIRYAAPSKDDLDMYLRDHAPRLREDFASHFPDGITLSRKEWDVLKYFA